MFKERPATSSLDQLVNPGSPPFIQSGAQQRVITGVPPVSTLIKTICSGGDNKKFLRFYHLVNPSIKTGPIIPWEGNCQNVKLDFFCQNGVSNEGDFFLLNEAMILNYVCFSQARRWLWIATSPSHDVLVLVRDLPIEKDENCYRNELLLLISQLATLVLCLQSFYLLINFVWIINLS